MLAVNFRIRKKWVITAVLGIMSVLLIAVLLCGANTNPKGKTTADRTAYLAKLGYITEDGSEQKCQIKIPKEFNKVYGEYNETQKTAGFDLVDFSGSVADMYSYSISNFKGYKDVYANLLVYENRIIGGDISGLQNGGFTLPLIAAENQKTE